MPASEITAVTRRRVLDVIRLERIAWAGRLDEVAFLSRLYDLADLPSTDRRYPTAEGDIRQHRINNYDWEDDWVFVDARFRLSEDEPFLAFLAEMLHPVVRSDVEEASRLLTLFNSALEPDGFRIVKTGQISGQATYGAQRIGSYRAPAKSLALESRPILTDSRVLHEHLHRIESGIQSDPAAAIASCKELLESLCKLILDRAGSQYSNGEDLPALYRRTSELLRLNAQSVPDSPKGSRSAQMVLRTLVTTVQGLAELRNELGLGHGRAATSPARARHARLAHNATVAVAEFLLDTMEARIASGALRLQAPP